MSKKKRPFRVGIISNDWHLPYPDEQAWSLFLQACKIIKPDFFVVNGDGVEFEGVSRFTSDASIERAFIDEVDRSREYIAEVEKALPKNCEKIWLEGNHEEWLRLYLASNAPALVEFDNVSWHSLLGLDEWEVLEANERNYPTLEIGNLLITHGDTSRKWSGWTVRADLHDRGRSLLIGHCHRMAAYFWTPKGNKQTTHVGYENGCLLDFNVANKYMKASGNWQHGFTVLTVDDKTGWFDVALKKIVHVKGTNKKRLMLHEGILEA